MSYQTDRDHYFYTMANDNIPIHVAISILKTAPAIDRLSVLQCNGPWTDKDNDKKEQLHLKMQTALTPYDVEVITTGDPRGYTTKLILPSGAYNTWGGKESGYGVPVKERY